MFMLPVENTPLSGGKTSVLEVKALTKIYNGLKAVNDVSFQIQKGEIFGFLGPNGAGKTTTIKSILGLIQFNNGEIRINGLDMIRDSKKAKRFVGYLPEKVAFYGNLTAMQNMRFYAEMKNASKADCESLITAFGLGDVIHKKVGQFSKGMVQRLGMARAMLGNPPILILDEPSGGLDPRGVVLIREKIRELKNQDSTIFVSSHILSEVQEVCDRVGIINKGILVAEDTVSNLGRKLNLKPKILLELQEDAKGIEVAVKNVNGVDHVTIKGKNVEVVCDPTVKAKVIVAIEQAGGNIVNLQTKEPSLEEVFMRYTED
jgi:ABC-type multidrug transport system ATPase subunit